MKCRTHEGKLAQLVLEACDMAAHNGRFCRLVPVDVASALVQTIDDLSAMLKKPTSGEAPKNNMPSTPPDFS